jgi:hypothetical protein
MHSSNIIGKIKYIKANNPVSLAYPDQLHKKALGKGLKLFIMT